MSAQPQHRRVGSRSGATLRALLGAVAAALVAVALLPLPPAQPAAAQVAWTPGLSAVAGYKTLDVSWSAATDCCGAGKSYDNYRVWWRSPSDTQWTASRSVDSTTTSATITGLGANVTYTLRISRMSISAVHHPTTITATTLASGKPDAPTITASGGSTGITVSWTAPGDNDSAITGYKLQWKNSDSTAADGSYSSSARQRTPGAAATSDTIPTASLTEDNEYTIRLAATNANGDSPWSAEITATGTPGASTSVRATAGSTAPTSADMARKINGSTTINPSSFPYTSPASPANPLACVLIVSLPDATQGTLKLKRTHRLYRRQPATNVTAGQCVANEQRQNSLNRTRLYFVPSGSFSEASFVFQVRDSKNQTSSASYTATLAKPASSVTAPTPTATAGNTQVALSWPQITSINVVKWQYRYKTGTNAYPSTGTGSWTDVPSSDASTTGYTVTGLTNGTAHTFQIRAGNALVNCRPADGCSGTEGWTAASAEVAATPLAVPAAPARIKGSSGPGAKEVTVSWDYAYDSTITGYEYRQYERDKFSNQCRNHQDSRLPSTWTDVASSSATTTEFKLTGVTAGDCMYVEVRAKSSSGSGASSRAEKIEIRSAAATVAYNRPAAPHGLTAAAGDTSATLTWDNPQNSRITGYEYRYKTGTNDYPTSGTGAWTAVTSSDASTVAATVSSLTNGVVHTFQLRAKDAGGNGTASAEVTATPTAPAAAPGQVTGLTAATGDRKVQLSWTAPASSVVTKYQYQQKTGSSGTYGGWTDVPGLTVTSFTLTDLTNATAYSFKVRAVNSTGDGAESSEVTATPAALAAPILCDDEETTDDDGDGFFRHSSCATGNYLVGGSYSTELATAIRWVLAAADSRITGWQVRMRHTGTCTTQTKSGATVTLPCQWSAWETINDSSLTHATRAANIVSSAKRYLNDINDEIALSLAGAQYDIQLRSQTALEAGPASNTIRLATLPASIEGISARGGNAKIYVRWDDPANPSITHYEIWVVQSAPSSKLYPRTALSGTSATTTSLTLTSLYDSGDGSTTNIANGSTYTLMIHAVNKWGSATHGTNLVVTPSATASAAPTPPTALSATGGGGSVSLTWTDPGDEYITKYQARFKKTSDASFPTTGTGSWTDIASSSATTTSHTISGLDDSTGYTVELRAVNNSTANTDRVGTAASVTATTLPPLPAAPTDVAIGNASTSATFLWADPVDSTITRWSYRRRSASGTWSAWWNLLVGTPMSVQCLKWQAAGGINKWIVDSTKATQCSDWTTDFAGTYRNNAQSNTPPQVISAFKNKLSATDPFFFQVRAVNARGAGPATTHWQVSQSVLSARPGDRQAVLSWSDPPPSRHGFTGWQYRQRTSGTWGDWTAVPSSTGSTRTYTVTGLTNGNSYGFDVRGVSGTISGPATGSVTVVPTTAPVAPSSVSATAGVNQVSLAWTLTTADSTITEWQYRYKTTGSYGLWTKVPSGAHATRSATVTGLASGAAYTFEVRAKNGAGDGAAATSAASAAVTPAAPAGLSVAWSTTASSADLSWSNPGDSGIAKYQYRTKTADSFGSWTDVTSSSASTTSATLSGLTGSLAYTIELRAASGSGGATTGAASSAVTPPTKPVLSVTGGDERVRLSWTNPGDGAVTGWQYSRRKGSGAWSQWASAGGRTASSHDDTKNLDNGTQYSYRLRAASANGASPASAAATVTPIAAPSAPTGVTATSAAGSASLSWTDPSDSSIAKWQYRCGVGNAVNSADWADVPSSSATTTSHTVTPLTNNTDHKCQVRAFGPLDPGTSSAAVSVRPYTTPAAPTGLSAAASGFGGVTLSWTAPSGDTITGWEVSYKKTSAADFGSWNDISGSSATTASHTVTGLDGGAGYSFKVRAENVRGAGAASAVATATPVAQPAAPANLLAAAVSTQVTLSWDKPADYDSVTRYELRRKTGSADWATWQDIGKGTAAGSRVSYVVSPVANGVTYAFRLRAVTAAGNGVVSSDVTASPEDPPAAPSGLSAAAGDGQVRLSWTDPSDSDITKYEVRQKTPVLGNWSEICTTPGDSTCPTTTSYTVTPLTNGTAYTFEVRAVSAMGNGPAALSSSAAPLAKPAKPTAFSASARDDGAHLSWTAATDSSITRWEYLSKEGANAWATTWTQISTTAATRSATVTGLTNATVYRFKVRAVNASGNGAQSDEASVTPTPPPDAPTVTAETLSGSRVRLSWADPGDDTITSWQYRYRTYAGAYPIDDLKQPVWTTVTGSDADTTTVTVGSLTAMTRYRFEVRAVSPSGPGAASAEALAWVYAGPALPTGLSAVAKARGIELIWTAATDSSITLWRYRCRAGVSWDGVNWTTVPSSNASTRSYTVPNLDNGTSYTCQVRARNSSGDGGPSPEASATPAPLPAAPTGASVSLTINGSNFDWTLSWTGPSNSTITRYEVRTKAPGGSWGSWAAIASSSASTTSYAVTSQGANTLAEVGLRAVNSSGNGDATAVLVLPGVPAGATATPKHTSADLAWTGASGVTATGWQYRYKLASASWPTTGTLGWTDVSGSGSVRAVTVTGLTNDSAYHFELRGVNAAGVGAPTATLSATPKAKPAKPSGLSAVGKTTAVDLSWTALGDTTVTGWQYRYKTSSQSDYPTTGAGSWADVTSSGAATTAVTVTGLTNGTSYSFQVRAANAYGSSDASDAATAAPEAVAAAPSGFAASGGDEQVTLSWTDPSDGTIDGYEYRYRTAGGTWGSWTTISNSDADTTSVTVTGLDNGTSYDFSVRAVNNNGVGAASTLSNVGTDLLAPVGLTATAGNTSVTLAWTDPSNSSISGWKYRYKTGSNDFPSSGAGSWTSVPSATASTTGYTVTGLNNLTVHTFELRAVNNIGDGPASAQAVAVPAASAPAAPTALTATGSGTSVNLSWTAALNASITGWQQRHKAGSGSYGNWTDIASATAAARSASIGLTAGTTYTFQLRAVNDLGNSSAATSGTTRTAPVAPFGLSAVAKDAHANLIFNAKTDSSITGYQVQATPDGGSAGAWAALTITRTYGDDTTTTLRAVASGLTNGTTHSLAVRSVNAAGSSGASSTASVTPLAVPAAPTGFSATGGSGQAALAWSDPSNSTITGYAFRSKPDDDTSSWGDWNAISGSGASTTRHTATGYDNGASYVFQVRASNASGDGAASAEKTARLAPAAASGLSAAPRHGSVILTWTALSDSTVTKWQYRYGTAKPLTGNWSDISGSGDDTATVTLASLTNGTTYHFEVRAWNAAGGGTAAAVSQAPVARPAAPASLTATGGSGQVVLAWVDPSDGSITGWQYRTRKINGSWGGWTDIAGSTATTVTATVSSLDNGAAYTFGVRAVNDSGNGTEATATEYTVPATPTGLVAAGSGNSVTLSWTNPGNNLITAWQYRANADDAGFGSWTDLCQTSSDTACPTRRSATVGSLQYATGYAFEVRGVNASGKGAGSAQATTHTAGAKPTGLSATAKDARVTLAWTDADDDNLTGWQYRYKASSQSNYADCSTHCGTFSSSTATTTSGDVTGLTNNTSYDLQVRSASPNGASAWSDAASATPVTKPSQPENLTATPGTTATTLTQVTLGWDDLDDSSVTKWQYQHKATGQDWPAAWTDVSGSGADTTSATVTGLDNGTTYTLRVRAYNAAEGGVASAGATALMAPAQPAGLAVVGRNGFADLSWTAQGDTSVSGWQYRYKTDGGYGNWTAVADSGAATASATVTGLTNGTEHTFQIRAVNATAAGVASAEASATPVPLPAKPTGLAVTFRDSTSSSYKWSVSWGDPGNSTITGWQFRTSAAAGSWDTWTDVADSTATTTSYQSPAAWSKNALRAVQVRAVNRSGSGTASDEASLLPSPQPAGLSATRVPSQFAANLSWTALGDASVDVWQVRRRAVGTPTWSLWRDLVGTDDSSTAHSNVAAQQAAQAEFQIRAVNEAGAGVASASATVMLSPSAATLTAVRCDANTSDSPAADCGGWPDGSTDDRDVGLGWTLATADTTITGWGYRWRKHGEQWPQNCTSANPPVCTDWWRNVSKPSGKQHHELRSQLIGSGLRHGNTYEFQVRASNAGGAGSVSNTVAVTMKPAAPQGITVSNVAKDGDALALAWSAAAGAAQYQYRFDAISLTGPPAKPANLSATAGNASVSLSWDGLGDLTVSRFDARWKKSSASDYGPWTPVPSSTNATTGHTVSGLTNGAEYSFQVRAVRPGAPGEASDAATATPSASASASNSSVRGGQTGGASAQAAQQQNCPTEGQWEAVNGTSVDVTCLTEGTEYVFQVRGTMAGGSDPGKPSSRVVSVPAQVPAKPANLSARPIIAGLDLRWDPGTEPRGAPITDWSVHCKIKNLDGTYGEWSEWAPVADSDELTVTARVSGLPYKGVACQVRANNSVGEGVPSDESREAVPLPTPDPGAGPGGGAGGGGGGGAGAPSSASSLRLGGADRYWTAVRAADQYMDEIADVAFVSAAIVVSGENFPDALAAASLSGRLKAPVLLVPRDSLPSGVRSFLERHQISDVRIVGGPAAVSDAVKAAIEALDAVETVTRIAGADRHATAVAVADAVGAPGALCGFLRRTVIVASGTSWPDAVVAGPVAYRGVHPVLLTSKGSLPAATREYLLSFRASHVLLLGGTAVVSDEVEREITGLGLFVTRVAGNDRYSTAAALATYLGERRAGPNSSRTCLGDNTVGLVTGLDFPDALAAAPVLGWYGAPVLLTPPDALPPSVIEHITSRWYQPADDIIEVVVVGGFTAVPSRLLRAFARARN